MESGTDRQSLRQSAAGGVEDGTANLLRENKYLLIKKKERNLTMIENEQEDDYFKLQQVSE